MTISSTSKLLSSRSPALQNLLRRYLLHPSATACPRLSLSATNPVPDTHFVYPSLLPKESFLRSSFDEPNPPLRFNASFRFHVTQFETPGELSGSGPRALPNGDGYFNHSGDGKASYDSDDSDSNRDSDDIDTDGGGESSDEDDDGYYDSEEENLACYDSDEERPSRRRPIN